MNTPIADFVRSYAKSNTSRLHMPGHKGQSYLGFEQLDITEIKGADSLYEADGIIAESEANATGLFGTLRTLYSTEGSSQCIRAMLYLALLNYRKRKSYPQSEGNIQGVIDNSPANAVRPRVVAARNVHKSFIYAAALLDLEQVWLMPEREADGLCSCPVTAEGIEAVLKKLPEPPAAVYLTSPDYLGAEQDIRAVVEVCHRYGTILAVDNAHGAYQHFLEESRHPIDLGADICCDSAHKTLPVLTGGAYLHIANAELLDEAKNAMALFGSTSPSYLILMSLDLCNAYLSSGYRELLADTVAEIDKIKAQLSAQGWKIYKSDPLKLTIQAPADRSGLELAEYLREKGIEAEYADPDYLVLMLTPSNDMSEAACLPGILGSCAVQEKRQGAPMPESAPQQCMSIREAVFARHETVSVNEASGRICGAPTVACPPAIPIVVSGERIGKEAITLFNYYDIEYVDVVSI